VSDNAGHAQMAADLDEREAEIYDLYLVKRWSQHRVAKHLGISQQRVSQHVADMRKKLPPVDIAAIRDASIAMYAEVARRAFELADKEGAPVTAGKDGDVVLDPESGEVVRDYGGRVAALALAIKADIEVRRLAGADAATKTESTATVRYELVGLDPEALA
jgi:DNA-binding CsgD family transcriptional regulator